MSVLGNTCGVRIYKGKCERCTRGCEHCRIGCWNPAAYRNPWFGKPGHPLFWWRDPYNYAEYLCVECYDSAVADWAEWEEAYKDQIDEEAEAVGSQKPEDE
jgi:hypothetical protein